MFYFSGIICLSSVSRINGVLRNYSLSLLRGLANLTSRVVYSSPASSHRTLGDPHEVHGHRCLVPVFSHLYTVLYIFRTLQAGYVYLMVLIYLNYIIDLAVNKLNKFKVLKFFSYQPWESLLFSCYFTGYHVMYTCINKCNSSITYNVTVL